MALHEMIFINLKHLTMKRVVLIFLTGMPIVRHPKRSGGKTVGILDKLFGTKPVKLTLSCRLNKNDALVFSNIVVTPFLSLSAHDKTCLDELFKESHLEAGTYYLAGYPDKGPIAIMKIGFTSNLSVYAKDVDRRKAADALFYEVSTGFMGDVLDLIEIRQGTRTKVVEVWWFHQSPSAENEWHAFMETFAHQMNEQIFFAPIKSGLKVGPLDFRKLTGSDSVTVSLELS